MMSYLRLVELELSVGKLLKSGIELLFLAVILSGLKILIIPVIAKDSAINDTTFALTVARYRRENLNPKTSLPSSLPMAKLCMNIRILPLKYPLLRLKIE